MPNYRVQKSFNSNSKSNFPGNMQVTSVCKIYTYKDHSLLCFILRHPVRLCTSTVLISTFSLQEFPRLHRRRLLLRSPLRQRPQPEDNLQADRGRRRSGRGRRRRRRGRRGQHQHRKPGGVPRRHGRRNHTGITYTLQLNLTFRNRWFGY